MIERRSNAADAVLQDLRTAITDGELPVGTRFPPEIDLASRYGVSRTVVREALHGLRTLGLTETRTGSGTFVVSREAGADLRLGEYSTRDLLEARPAIEIPAAGLAALRRSDVHVSELRALAAQMERTSDPRHWVALDGEFHAKLAQASGNALFEKVLVDAMEALKLQSQLIGVLTDRWTRIGDSNKEHQAVVDAVAAGDSDRAEDAMRVHLSNVAAIVSGRTLHPPDLDHEPL